MDSLIISPSRKKPEVHNLSILSSRWMLHARETQWNNRDREKSLGQSNIWTIGAAGKYSAQPQLKYKLGKQMTESVYSTALIKKKIEFSSYIRKFRKERLQSHIWGRASYSNIWGNMRKYLVIFEEAVGHICLCNRSRLNSLIYEENWIFFFLSVSPIRTEKKFA